MMITLRYRDLLVAVKLCRLHTLAAVAETEGVGPSRIGQLRNRALSSIRFGYLEDYLHSRPFHPRHVLERCAAHSGQSAEALCASLYEPLVNEIHQNGPDAPYWLAVPHEGPVPTPEEILLFLYREYHRQLNDPLFYPACYPL